MGRMFNLGLLKKRLTLSPVLQSFQEEVQDSRINLFKELERKERGAGTENTSPSYTACFARRGFSGTGLEFVTGKSRSDNLTNRLPQPHYIITTVNQKLHALYFQLPLELCVCV
ncbi:hypothetical protein TNCV_4353801 [Trichonephila clavipes]|nr:hypothetical protein TNCV_4353801 [Trichonephila clavipes]